MVPKEVPLNQELLGPVSDALLGSKQQFELALLWYDLFTSNLKEMGVKLNPYDPCVANATIEGKQCTLAWYIDDTKISHVNPDVVTRVIVELEKCFDKMTVTRGREHAFWGCGSAIPTRTLRSYR
jgi:hypothetical protein